MTTPKTTKASETPVFINPMLFKLKTVEYAPLDIDHATGEAVETDFKNLLKHIAEKEKLGADEDNYGYATDQLDIAYFDEYIYHATKKGAHNAALVFHDMLHEIKYWRGKEAARLQRNEQLRLNRIKRIHEKFFAEHGSA
jgi:hypothetical protein